MNFPPCKTIKCLKYPICKNKITIHCDLLEIEAQDFYQGRLNSKDVWDAINRLFPTLLFLSNEEDTITHNNLEGLRKEKWKYQIRIEEMRIDAMERLTYD